VPGELVVAGMVAVGLQLSLQAPVNGALARQAGPLGAALVSFLVGLALIGFVLAVSGQLGAYSGLGSLQPYELVGGLCGAGYVAAATFAIGRIGAGAVAAATVAGQLSSGVAVDHFGGFGLETDAVDPLRLLAIPVLVAGALMVAGDRPRDGGHGLGTVRPLPLALVFLAGLAVGVQHPLNSSLAEGVGELGASGLNFATGSLALFAAVVATGGLGRLRMARKAPPWAFTGGLFGAVTVLSSLAAVGTIGASTLAATTIAGALAGSVVIDRFGIAGVTVRPLHGHRIFGLGMLAAGTVAVL
jgi:transporter family-2 protein